MKKLYFLLILLLLVTGCFARGGDLSESNISTIPQVVNSEKLKFGGFIRADSDIFFSFIQPSISPVNGALITIEETGEKTMSDSSGYFEFISLNPGTYHLTAFRHLSTGEYFKCRKEIKLVAGINIVNNEFTIKRTGGISGKLILGGIETKDVHIEIAPSNKIISPSYNGTFIFEQLVEGTYSVTLFRTGYKSLKMGVYEIPAGGIIQLPTSSPPTTPDNTIFKSLKLNIFDESTSILHGVKVKLKDNGKLLYSNKSGEVTFNNLQVDTVEVICFLHGYEQNINIVELSNSSNNSIIYMKKSLIYHDPKLILNVKNEFGNNIEGVRIVPNPELELAYTDFYGNGIIYLNSGTSSIIIEKLGYNMGTLSVFINANNILTSEIVLTKSGITTFYNVSGKVINSETGLGQVDTWIIDNEYDFAVKTDSNGDFALSLPAGNYRLNADYLTFFKGYKDIVVNNNLSGLEITISR